MASLDRNAPRNGRPRFSTLTMIAPVLILTAAAISGCAASQDRMTTSAINDDYRQRHPIVLMNKEHNIDIPVAASDRRLTIGMRDTVRGFVQDYRAHASGTIEILAPRGSVNSAAASALRQQIRRELVANGIRSGVIAESSYAAGDYGDAAPIRLRFAATTATTNTCGQWPEDLSDNAFDNQNYYNFGCASQSNLAAQVANPTDLVAPRAVSPIDTDQRAKVINDYRTGSVATSTATLGGFSGTGGQ
ncbi:CpaD family pilus assembly lipoprotein [Rhizobium sp. P38BS-XIX]|uniref:CpaD family pilus assembly protein n=1 Tax=Rhizobium sp. P38BS-XIX TaxID=2726740 RepID=UPI001456C8B7|nr:CpaD family pilus assembly lipoprotein [Rhizobium sp. P38BS-XIX]NLR98555.1 CpaD family pilus assembly lipoprotein [Rhizobium sp. P38BS-XIX]